MRLPNTAVRPTMNIEGASTPGMAAPGTRAISLIPRRISDQVVRASTAMPVMPVMRS